MLKNHFLKQANLEIPKHSIEHIPIPQLNVISCQHKAYSLPPPPSLSTLDSNEIIHLLSEDFSFNCTVRIINVYQTGYTLKPRSWSCWQWKEYQCAVSLARTGVKMLMRMLKMLAQSVGLKDLVKSSKIEKRIFIAQIVLKQHFFLINKHMY